MPGDPADVKALGQLKGQLHTCERQGQKVCIATDGEMWVFGLKDGVMNDDDAIVLIFGEFLLGQQAEKVLTESRESVWKYAITDESHEGGYGTNNAKSEKEYEPRIGPLSCFLAHLETALDVDVNTLSFAMHEVKAATKKDAAGDVMDRTYTIKPTEACAFKPLATPRKHQATWEDAGSLMCLGAGAAQWDFITGKHSRGYLQMYYYLKYQSMEQGVGVVPKLLAIYLTTPVTIEKDKLIRIA